MHQVGKKYKHKRTGGLMTIEKINGKTSKCRKDKPSYYTFAGIKYENYTAICRLENLLETEENYTQTKLF